MDYMTATREEVERELERKMASIAGSVSRIKKDLSLPTEPVKAAVKQHPLEFVVGAVLAGLVAGWIVKGNRKQSRKSAPQSKSGDSGGTAQFLRILQAARDAGLTEEEAVARALAATSTSGASPRMNGRRGIADRAVDHVVDMADAVVKTALRVAAREAAAWVAEAVRRDKPPSSQ